MVMPRGRRSSLPVPVPRASGKTTEESGHGGHHDGAETKQAGLVDGFFRTLAALPFRDKGEVNHHDGVLLHDADEQDDADHGDDTEIGLGDQEGNESTDAGRGKGRENGQGMDEALIEHPEHDIDGNKSESNKVRLGGEGCLEGLSGALEATADGGGHTDLNANLFDGRGGVAQRGAGRQVEAERGCGRLGLMVDGERNALLLQLGDGGKWNHGAGRALHVDVLERVEIALVLLCHFHDDVILVERHVGG